MSRTPVLEMRHIAKTFGNFHALKGVDLTVFPGEIHALLGENGAGKSTLIKVLTGVEERDGGTVLLEGKEIFPKTPQEAQDAGITKVVFDRGGNKYHGRVAAVAEGAREGGLEL